MNLAKVFKQFSKLKKKDDDFRSILRDVIAQASDNDFRDSVEVQVTRDFFETEWIYYQNSEGKKISGYKYSEKRSEVREKKGKDGLESLAKEWTQVYDPKMYEKDIDRLKSVCVQLNKLGFKTKMIYSKDYLKKTLEDEPDCIWLRVAWS